MRIDIVSLQVVSIDKAISLMMDVLVAIVLKALAVEILAEGSVGEISRLVFQLFVILLHLLFFL